MLGSLSKPEQLFDKLVNTVLDHETKVRSEQQVAKTSARKMVIEKKPGCVDSGYDQKLGDDHLGYDTSGCLNSGYNQKLGDDQLGYDKSSSINSGYDQNLGDSHLGYDKSGCLNSGYDQNFLNRLSEKT